MIPRVLASVLTLVVGLSIGTVAAPKPPYFRAPALTEQARIVPGGRSVLPNGRFITPKGKRLYVGDNLWRVVVRPDGKAVVGIYDDALAIYALPHAPGNGARVIRVPGVAFSAAFTRDSSRLIVAGGEQGGVLVFDARGWEKPVPRGEDSPLVATDQKPEIAITANAGSANATYINAVAVHPDERVVFGVDIAHQRVIAFDLVGRKVLSAVKAGREPYALALSEDGKTLFVANIGLFDYALVGPPAPG
ncbi:MAG: hypothetical protein HXY24_17800, partial [Rubrivivax sp.]|nr:hypothetical protein [Rubrivivax sp.]